MEVQYMQGDGAFLPEGTPALIDLARLLHWVGIAESDAFGSITPTTRSGSINLAWLLDTYNFFIHPVINCTVGPNRPLEDRKEHGDEVSREEPWPRRMFPGGI